MVRDSAGRRFILTAAHVVAGAEAILARTSNPDEHAVATVLLALDPVNDLALLGTELALPAAELGNLDDGQRGIAIVFRGGTATPLPFRVVNRAVVNIDDIYGENTISRSGYRVEIELQPGDSGAVMVDADGSAAGVLYSKSRTVAGNAFATDTSTLGDLMRDAAIADPIRGIDSGECP